MATVAIWAAEAVASAITPLIAGTAFSAAGMIAGGLVYSATLVGVTVAEVWAVGEISNLINPPPKLGTGGSPVDWKADPQAPVPYVIGRTGTSGNIVFADVAGDKNKYLTYATVLSLGPVKSIGGFKANDVLISFTTDAGEGAGTGQQTTTLSAAASSGATVIQVTNTAGFLKGQTITVGGQSATIANVYAAANEIELTGGLAGGAGYGASVVGPSTTSFYQNRMWWKSSLGARPQSTALHWTATGSKDTPADHGGQPSTWSASAKLSGLAHTLWTLEYATETYTTGTPKPIQTVEGVFCYDPRLDSTYPGGSGSCRSNDETTWVYSENPYIHALTWLIGRTANGVRTMGVHAPISCIDVGAFVAGANVADANGWTIGGVISSTDGKWDVLKAMLIAGAGAPVKRGAMISCVVSTPQTSLDTLTGADVVGDVTVPATASRRTRINAVWPRYREEGQDWQIVPTDAPVVVSAYVSADGEQRTREVEYSLVQDADQVATLARYDIENAREIGPIVLPCKPRWMGYRPGDCITVNEPEYGLNYQKVVIINRNVDPATMITTLTVRSETDDKHAYALAETADPPPSPALTSIDPAVLPPPQVSDWTATGGTVNSGASAFPVVTIVGACPDPNVRSVLFGYRLNVDHSTVSIFNEVPIDGTAATVTQPISGLAAKTSYIPIIQYRSVRGVLSEPLELAPVITGAAQTPTQGWNVINNASFADGDALGWRLSAGSSVVAASAAGVPAGCPSAYCLKMQAHAGDNSDCYYQGTIDVVPGQVTYLSAYVAPGDGANLDIELLAFYVSADGTESTWQSARTQLTTGVVATTTSPTTSGWRLLAGQSIAPTLISTKPPATVTYWIAQPAAGGAAGYWYVTSAAMLGVVESSHLNLPDMRAQNVGARAMGPDAQVTIGDTSGGAANSATLSGAHSDSVFWAGGATPSTAPFSIDRNGKIYASGLTLHTADGTKYFDAETGFSSAAISQIFKAPGSPAAIANTISQGCDNATSTGAIARPIEVQLSATADLSIVVALPTSALGWSQFSSDSSASQSFVAAAPTTITLTLYKRFRATTADPWGSWSSLGSATFTKETTGTSSPVAGYYSVLETRTNEREDTVPPSWIHTLEEAVTGPANLGFTVSQSAQPLGDYEYGIVYSTSGGSPGAVISSAATTITVNDTSGSHIVVGGGGTGGGAIPDTFPALSDVPSSYSGSSQYFLRVKSDASGLEFLDPASASVGKLGGAAPDTTGTASTIAKRGSDGSLTANLQVLMPYGSTVGMLRNDGSNLYLLKSASSGATFDSDRPLIVNLSTGALTLDAGAKGTTLGGHVTFANSNPRLQSSSYIEMTGGAYVSGGNAYFAGTTMHRSGLQNDIGDFTLHLAPNGGRLKARNYFDVDVVLTVEQFADANSAAGDWYSAFASLDAYLQTLTPANHDFVVKVKLMRSSYASSQPITLHVHQNYSLWLEGGGNMLDGSFITTKSGFSGSQLFTLAMGSGGTDCNFKISNISLSNTVGGSCVTGAKFDGLNGSFQLNHVDGFHVRGFQYGIYVKNSRMIRFDNWSVWQQDIANAIGMFSLSDGTSALGPGGDNEAGPGLIVTGATTGGLPNNVANGSVGFCFQVTGTTATQNGWRIQSTVENADYPIKIVSDTSAGGAVGDIWILPGTQFDNTVVSMFDMASLQSGSKIYNIQFKGVYCTGQNTNPSLAGPRISAVTAGDIHDIHLEGLEVANMARGFTFTNVRRLWFKDSVLHGFGNNISQVDYLVRCTGCVDVHIKGLSTDNDMSIGGYYGVAKAVYIDSTSRRAYADKIIGEVTGVDNLSSNVDGPLVLHPHKGGYQVNGVFGAGGNNANIGGLNTGAIETAFQLANSGKMVVAWNYSGGEGETDLIFNRGAGGVGGFSVYDSDNSTFALTRLMRLTGSGDLNVLGLGTFGGDISATGIVNASSGFRHTGSGTGYIDFNEGGAAGNIHFRNGSAFTDFLMVDSSQNLTAAANFTAYGNGRFGNGVSQCIIYANGGGINGGGAIYFQDGGTTHGAVGYASNILGGTLDRRLMLYADGNSPVVYGQGTVETQNYKGAAGGYLGIAASGAVLVNTTTDNGSDKLQVAGGAYFSAAITAISGEHHFGKTGYLDPDPGTSRALKIGADGLAVRGGTRTDTLDVNGGRLTQTMPGSDASYVNFASRTTTYGAGGGGVNAMAVNYLTVSAGSSSSYEWANLSVVNSQTSDTAGQHVGYYSQINKSANGPSLWCFCGEFSDTSGAVDPTSSQIGMEMVMAIGGGSVTNTDAHRNRVLFDVSIRKKTSVDPDFHAAYGFRLSGNPGATLDRAFQIGDQCIIGFNVANTTVPGYTSTGISFCQFLGDIPMALKTDQFIAFDSTVNTTTNNVSYSRKLRYNASTGLTWTVSGSDVVWVNDSAQIGFANCSSHQIGYNVSNGVFFDTINIALRPNGGATYFQSTGGAATWGVWTSSSLNVYTNIDATSKTITAGSYVTASDRSLKTNIQPIIGAMDMVRRLQGSHYDLIDGDDQQIGFIANDLLPVVPWAVGVSPGGLLGIDYGRLTAVHNEAIKDVDARVVELEATVAALTARLDKLSLAA